MLTTMVEGRPKLEIFVFSLLAIVPASAARLNLIYRSLEMIVDSLEFLFKKTRGRHSAGTYAVSLLKPTVPQSGQALLYFLSCNLLVNAIPDSFEVQVPKLLQFLDANGDGTLEAEEIEQFVYRITSRILQAVGSTLGLLYCLRLKKPPLHWTMYRSLQKPTVSKLEQYWQISSSKSGWWALLDRIVTGFIYGSIVYLWVMATGFSPKAITVFGGAGGLAIGFAAQAVVGNMVAAMIIMATAPFSKGDLVEAGTECVRYLGIVQEIGWNSTCICTSTNAMIYVPNSTLLNIPISVARVAMDDEDTAPPPIFSKDEDTFDDLREQLMQTKMFGILDESKLRDVIDVFRPRLFVKGDVIYRQGEVSDVVYLLVQGEASVDIAGEASTLGSAFDQAPRKVIFGGRQQSGANEEEVDESGKGTMMSYLALAGDCPQPATLRVTSESLKGWAVNAQDLRRILRPGSTHWESTAEGSFIKYEGWLSEVDVLGCINSFELNKIAMTLEEEEYSANEVIIAEGEPGERFYILESGVAVASKVGVGVVKLYSKPGEYFGELALLRNQPRGATVSAGINGCTVCSMSKEEFMSFLGPMTTLIKKQVDIYNFSDGDEDKAGEPPREADAASTTTTQEPSKANQATHNATDSPEPAPLEGALSSSPGRG